VTSAPIAITSGEPAGIGPEIALRAALATERLCVVLGDRALLEQTARSSGLAWPPPNVSIQHEALAEPVAPGHPRAANARYVLRLLDRAVDGCLAGEFCAMATAPVHKAVINDAGIAFSGHTEYLAAATAAPSVVMMLVGGGLRVALATTHLPLAKVAAAITAESLGLTLDVVHHDLRGRFAIPRPHIAVAGLNPHAGESGYLGREEIEVIGPAVAAARARGIDADGPWPADTLFVPVRARAFDAIVAMYHDQGLAPLKYASFGHGVNVTLGLPIVRTSVDHGTAFDLAGTGRADPASMLASIELAAELAAHEASTTPRAGREGVRNSSLARAGEGARNSSLARAGEGARNSSLARAGVGARDPPPPRAVVGRG
jgi:4-hydroxythreonine-4-phosphate dehydrogenase